MNSSNLNIFRFKAIYIQIISTELSSIKWENTYPFKSFKQKQNIF